MKLKSLLFIIVCCLFHIISPQAYANEPKFILKKNSGKLVFELDIPKDCYIYGSQPGETGLPTTINLESSKNLKNYQLLWPLAKQKTSSLGKQIHYYEKNLEIPLIVEFIDSKQNIELKFNIEYVLCSNQCQLFKENISTIIVPFDETISHKNTSDLLYNNYLLSLLAAVLGGFILNFMPCVLPVLSLKVISFINHPNIDRKKASLFTIAGIITSFLILAIFAISLKQTDKYLNLGLNFQEPNFIIALILVITFFISGSLERIYFNFPSIINNYLLNIKFRREYFEHYFSGILATVLSTPCNAPFLGTALFLILDRSELFICLTFIMIGIGFSLPYIALLLWPKILNFLPKSGKWMYQLKLILIFLLICTLFWLLFILSDQLNIRAVTGLFLLLILIKFILENNSKIFKNWYIKLITLILLVILSFILPQYCHTEDQDFQEKIDNLWQDFEPEKIEDLVNNGKIVVVDITANWCITCKYNKYLTLDTQKAIKILSNNEIIAMRGDFTNHNPKIQEFLIKKQVPGIPYNIIYGPAIPHGKELPLIFSIEELNLAIKKAKL